MADNNNNMNTNTKSKIDISTTTRKFRKIWGIDKNVVIILSMIIVAAAAIFINVLQSYHNQANIINQNDRLIADVDNNSALVKAAMKDIGNATTQREAAYLIKQNAIEMAELKILLNDTHAKLDKLILK